MPLDLLARRSVLQKPPFGAKLNRSHPLAQGLRSFWLLNEEGGLTLYDAVSNAHLAAGSNTAWHRVKGEHSLRFHDSGTLTNGDVLGGTTAGHQLTLFTHIIWFIPKSGSIGNQPLMTIAEAPGHATHDRNLYTAVSGAYVGRIFDGANKFVASTTLAVADVPNLVIIVADGTNFNMYVDGVLEGSIAAGNAFTGYATPELVFGHGFNGSVATGRSVGSFILAGVVSRPWSAQEVRQFSANPYQLFEPPVWRKYYVVHAPTAYFRTLSGDLPASSGAVARRYQALRSVSGSIPSQTGTVTRRFTGARILSGSMPNATGTLTRIANKLRSLTGSIPAQSGTLTRRYQALRLVAGSIPAQSGSLSRSKQNLRTLTGSIPNQTGTLTRRYQALRSLTGALPAQTGNLVRLAQKLRTVVGAMPTSTGTLARKLQALRTLTGSPLAPSGELARRYTGSRTVSGSIPSASGALARSQHTSRALAGVFNAGTGVLSYVLGIITRTLTGSLPAQTGNLTRQLQAIRSVSGDIPAQSGSLTRVYQAIRVLTGELPSQSGTLNQVSILARLLTGSLPAPSGTLTRSLIRIRNLIGVLPGPTGTLSRHLEASRTLVGSLPSLEGSLNRTWHTFRSLAGTLGSFVGSVVASILGPPDETLGRPTAVATKYQRADALISKYNGDTVTTTYQETSADVTKI